MTRTMNPARLDFASLKLFCAVARHGSITKGAQACHLALSAASRRLAELESAAGTRLLERTAQGVSLTPAGHVALQHATRLFQGFEQFGSELRDYSRGAKGHVRLWANMSALTEFLPAALASFRARQPHIRIEIEEQLSGDIVRALVDGVADLGVFAGNVPMHGLDAARFRSDRLVVVCPRGHPLARSRRIAFAACLDYDFVGLNRGSSLLDLTAQAASEAGREMRLTVQVRSFDAMCHMIAADLGIGVVPLAACRAQVSALGLKAVTLTDAWADRWLLMAARPGGEPSPAAAALIAHLRALAD